MRGGQLHAVLRLRAGATDCGMRAAAWSGSYNLVPVTRIRMLAVGLRVQGTNGHQAVCVKWTRLVTPIAIAPPKRMAAYILCNLASIAGGPAATSSTR
jgi:hypothetical protein